MDDEQPFGDIVHIYLLFYRNVVCMCLTYLAFKYWYLENERSNRRNGLSWNTIQKIPDQLKYLRRLVENNDHTCIKNLRMDRNCFANLCALLETVGGLQNEKFVSVPEKVAVFVSILAHHKKNVTVQTDFQRSGHTISKYFRQTLRALIKCSRLILVRPDPVPEDSTHPTWKYFKGCLGALDGTHIKVLVPARDQTRYINRKGEVTVNVLGVCNVDMNFVYVLTGWEGSAADSRILKNALLRSNGLRVADGNYYLCDLGYTNSKGFLAPYRTTRYHLDEWAAGSLAPQSFKEYFNMRHCRARNVIERTFGLLKGRWAVLRSKSFYPLRTQNMIILCCALLHNFIRTHMAIDPLEVEILDSTLDNERDDEFDFVDTVEPSTEWSNWRDTLATNMYHEWRATRGLT